jgi:hypothetical protein
MKYEAQQAQAAGDNGLPVIERLVITRLHSFQVGAHHVYSNCTVHSQVVGA